MLYKNYFYRMACFVNYFNTGNKNILAVLWLWLLDKKTQRIDMSFWKIANDNGWWN
jgi:hypothetical protein